MAISRSERIDMAARRVIHAQAALLFADLFCDKTRMVVREARDAIAIELQKAYTAHGQAIQWTARKWAP